MTATTTGLEAAFDTIIAACPALLGHELLGRDNPREPQRVVARLDRRMIHDSASSCAWTADWWNTHRIVIGNVVARRGGFDDVDPVEAADIIEAAVLVCAVAQVELAVEVVADLAVQALRLRQEQLVEAVQVQAPAAPVRVRPVRRPKYRKVVFQVDFTDRRGRVIAAEGAFGDVVEWPAFATPTIRITDRNRNHITLKVPRRYLARI